MPLCPPTPSLGHMWDIEKAGRNRLSRFPADALRSDEKLRPRCKHRAVALSSFPLPALFIVCVMSSFTGRRAEGHGRVIRRLDMKEQRFFVIMQIQLYVKLYFTAISDLLQFEPYCQPGFYGVLQIIAIGTVSLPR